MIIYNAFKLITKYCFINIRKKEFVILRKFFQVKNFRFHIWQAFKQEYIKWSKITEYWCFSLNLLMTS